MANNYKIIDEKTWERAMHCMVFRNSIEPQFCVTFEANITNFKEKVKNRDYHLLWRWYMQFVNVPMR